MAGSFLTVECGDCENEQVVFEKAATPVSCAVCGHQIADPTGGIASINGTVLESVASR